MYARSKILTFILANCLLALSCATPIPPSGGVTERTPPKIISTVPQTGTTLVKGNTVQIEFDRFMNRNSITRAIQIEPDLGIPYTIDWKRKTMVLRFTSSFPDSVTVILSLGADIADLNGNRLTNPYQLAFSTGATIDSASVDFKVISFDKANGISGEKIGLFKDDFSNRSAIYMADSDTAGIVRFRYAREGQYIARLFDDRNRNRIPDENEMTVAYPEPITVVGDSTRFSGHFVISRQDSLPPSLLGVGLLSSERIRVRFSDSIRLNKHSSISIVDTKGDTYSGIWLYTDPVETSVAIGRSSVSLDPQNEYFLELDSISDTNGNYFKGRSGTFAGSTRSDTTIQRIVRLPDPSFVLPSDTFLVVYSNLIQPGSILDSLTVVDGEIQRKFWSGFIVSDNKLYVFNEDGWRPGQSYQIRYWSPSDQRYINQNFRVQRVEDLSSVELSLPENWRQKQVIVELLDSEGIIVRRVIESSSADRISISSLAPGKYRLRAWLDENRNGRWDQDQSDRFKHGREAVFIQSNLILSARMTSVLMVEEIF
jgi:hypothetical protein